MCSPMRAAPTLSLLAIVLAALSLGEAVKVRGEREMAQENVQSRRPTQNPCEDILHVHARTCCLKLIGA